MKKMLHHVVILLWLACVCVLYAAIRNYYLASQFVLKARRKEYKRIKRRA